MWWSSKIEDVFAGEVFNNSAVIAFFALVGVEAVSYTHLDVYKRQ